MAGHWKWPQQREVGARAPGSILDHCFLDKLPGLIILSRVLGFVLNPRYVLESLKVLFFWETPALAAICTGRSRMPPKSILIISYWSSSWRLCLIRQLCSEHIIKSFWQSSENRTPVSNKTKGHRVNCKCPHISLVATIPRRHLLPHLTTPPVCTEDSEGVTQITPYSKHELTVCIGKCPRLRLDA